MLVQRTKVGSTRFRMLFDQSGGPKAVRNEKKGARRFRQSFSPSVVVRMRSGSHQEIFDPDATNWSTAFRHQHIYTLCLESELI